METSRVNYIGNLRTTAVHCQSDTVLITDAPKDNNGNGESFSPTDLTATSLASCMLTMMGIVARNHGIAFQSASANVWKHMASAPRRIEKIEVGITISGNHYSAREKKLLEESALSCPVAKSLHPNIEQAVSFRYSES
ncbi:MAG: OsmC family peroxiredoxin [Cryomorphaceae bacterium]|nr:MAG: OsmC family peroxiredoxin [Cryomorphaceae bacterium]